MKGRATRLLALFCCVLLGACATKIPPNALQLSPESLKDREMQTRYFETGDEQSLLSSSAQVLQDLGFNIVDSETDLGLIVGSKHRDSQDAGQIAASVTLALLLGVYMPTDQDQIIRVSLVTRPLDFNRDQPEAITDKLRQALVEKIKGKTRTVLDTELQQGLKQKLPESTIRNLSQQLTFRFGTDLSDELKARLKEGRTAVRITFQRIVYNDRREVTTREAINDAKIYQQFFDKLGESVFLEAHEL